MLRFSVVGCLKHEFIDTPSDYKKARPSLTVHHSLILLALITIRSHLHFHTAI